MKTKRKALLLSLCAVLLVVASVMGTMAYLTDSAEVKNTFTVGSNVAITLDEAKVDENGVPVPSTDDKPVARVDRNEYKLMPGHTYTKDPTVRVTGEDCYVFVKVSNGISTIEATGNTTIAAQMAANGWKAVDGQPGLYIYAKGEDTKTVANANDELHVFGTFTVKDDAKIGDLEAVKTANITITAYAVQKDGFENSTSAQIWNATFGG